MMKQSLLMIQGLLPATLIFFSSFPNSAFSVHPQFHDCVPKTCEHGPNISYPFWLPSHPLHCGYPLFNLTCNRDGYPVLRMPQGDYRVQRIYDQNQTVILVDDHLIDNPCPQSAHNLSLFRTPFQVSRNQLHLTFHFNCTTPISKDGYYSIRCVTNDSFAMVRGEEDPMTSGMSSDCGTTVEVPIDETRTDYVQTKLSSNDYKALWVKGSS